MNFVYKKDESPEERIRNKISVIFLTIEVANKGDCDKEMIRKSLKVMPQIVKHLEDIEEFYKKKYAKN